MKRVLEKLGWTQIPNHSDDYLTFKSSFGEPIVFKKENDYNLDYFHKILRMINVPPVLFVKLNSEKENSI